MPIEDVFSISGPGTVVTGRVERGVVKVGDEIEIVGLKETAKTTCTGVEMFRKLLDQGQAGDNVGVCCAAPSGTRWSAARFWPSGLDHAAHGVHMRGLYPDQGEGGRHTGSSRTTGRSFISGRRT